MDELEISMVYFNAASGMQRPQDLREHFREMREAGVDSIITQTTEKSVAEGLRFKVELAHEAGLRVYAVPGRFAGLFAAGVVPSSYFAALHPDTRMRRVDVGTPPPCLPICCVNNPKFEEWFYPHVLGMVRDSGADGIFFDEPKDAHDACYCEFCKALVEEPGKKALTRLREDSMAAMMGRVCAEIKALDSTMTTGVLLMPDATGNFRQRVSGLKHLDYFGVDGPLCRQGDADRPADRQKALLLETVPKFLDPERESDRKVCALVETFDVRPWAYEELRQNAAAIEGWGLDLIAFNYYAHDNPDPEGVMDLVWEAIKRLRGGEAG